MLKGSTPFLPEEGFDFDSSIQSYSEEGFKQVGVSDIGLLMKDYKADFIVVKESNKVRDFEVLETFLNGKKVY
jgi:predicted amidohydrolase YtcJ